MAAGCNSTVLASSDIVEDLLNFTSDAHCWFDGSGRLLSFSDSTLDYFPELKSILTPLTPYLDVLRVIRTGNLYINLPENAENDNWEQDQLSLFLGTDSLSFKNHLRSGVSLKITRMVVRDGRRLLLINEFTSQYRERRARALSDEKFRQFATLSSNWFWDLDADLRYLYHSSHCQPLAGIDAASLMGKSRINSLDGQVKNDEQLHEHNACLLARKNVDVVLTWERPNDTTVYSHILAQPQFDKNGAFKGYLGCGRDVSSFYELKQQYKYQANHDYLTKLLNRRAFENLIQGTIDNLVQPESGLPVSSLILIDLDRFKLVNDEGGHSAGDQLLVEIAELLSDIFPKPSSVARLGGDEFGVHVAVDESTAAELAQGFIQRVGDFVFSWNNRSFTIGASAGVAQIHSPDTSPSELLRDADAACYAAKRLGRNLVQVFSAQNTYLVHQRVEADKLRCLKSALHDNRVALYLQPIIAAEAQKTCNKYEVLLRVLDKSGEVHRPGEFIPVAEKYGIMQDVDLMVVERSLYYLREFHKQGAEYAFSINLSGNSLSNALVLQKIVDMVSENQDLASSICFELTETAAINSLKMVVEYIDKLRGLGCEFALDDFGTGLSSYNYLNVLKVDYLKIDGSFVKSMLEDSTSLAIVKSINTLSHEMNMRTVAEHVSELALADVLVDIKVDYLQGFHYGKPIAIEEVLSSYVADILRTGTVR